FLFVKEDASSVRKLFDFLLYGLVFSFFMNLFSVVYEVISIAPVADLSIFGYISVYWKLFMNEQFSALVNPSYVSLYILLVLSYHLKKELNSIWRFLAVLILFVYLFLLASEAAYYTIFIMAVLLVWKVKDRSKRYLLVLTVLLGTIVFVNNPHFFNEPAIEARQHITDIDRADLPITEHDRWLTWKAAIKAIEE